MKRAPTTYDGRHPYAEHGAKGIRWHGDPARGEFVTERMTPKRKPKRGKR